MDLQIETSYSLVSCGRWNKRSKMEQMHKREEEEEQKIKGDDVFNKTKEEKLEKSDLSFN